MKRLALVAFLAVGAVIPGAYYGRAPLAASEPRSWPLTAQDKRALKALGQDERELLTALAPVCSGVKPEDVLRYLAPKLRELDEADRELAANAAKRCGVAVVVSGSEWVPR
jgi:hypothetical protein